MCFWSYQITKSKTKVNFIVLYRKKGLKFFSKYKNWITSSYFYVILCDQNSTPNSLLVACAIVSGLNF